MYSRLLLISSLILTSSLALANPQNHLTESGIDTKGLITIQPHTRSAALNAKHAAECAKIGGEDITDQTPIQITPNTVDAALCRIKVQPTTHSNPDNGSVVCEAPSGGPFDSYIISGYGICTFKFSDSDVSFWPYVDSGADVGNCREMATVYVGQPITYKSAYFITCDTSKQASDDIATKAAGCMNSGNHYCGPIDDKRGIIKRTPSNFYDESANKGNPDITPSCNMPSSFFGNPINIAIGNKFQREVDISGSGVYPLSFIRSYNSIDGLWRYNYSMHMYFYEGNNIRYYVLVNNEGKESRFNNVQESETNIYSSRSELGKLKKVSSGYEYTSPFNEVYSFNQDGKLIKTVNNGGIVRNIKHTSDTQLVVSDTFGHSLTITETKDHQPLSVKSSDGITASYEYDTQDRLVKTTVDGKTKTYHYEDGRFPRALTGITNERGIRYVTWTYDDKGRANSSYHIGDKDKVSLVYNSDTQTTMTNPLGRKYVYNYGVVDGLKRITSINGQASSLCPVINSSYQYNNLALVTMATDGRGINTQYNYNASGQETSRVVGYGSANAVTIKTTWDDRFNLPKTETYPDKVITYDYDNKGNLVNRTVSAN